MNKIIKSLNRDRIDVSGPFPFASVPEWLGRAAFNPSCLKLLNLFIVDCVLHSL